MSKVIINEDDDDERQLFKIQPKTQSQKVSISRKK